jgi:cytoskeletal protein CcmA (bactofilin family)
MALKDIMNRGGEQTTQGTKEPSAPLPPARPPRTVAPSTCIDASTELHGTLRCRETFRIDGRLEGEIHCEKNVIVGEGATVRAGIEAEEVAISGEVKGDISARRKITLDRTARVIGDLCTPGIVIEEGAKLEGRIMIGSEDKPEAKVRTEQRAEAKPTAAPTSAKPTPKAPLPPPAS